MESIKSISSGTTGKVHADTACVESELCDFLQICKRRVLF